MYKGEGFKRTSAMGLGDRKVCSGDLGVCLNRVSLRCGVISSCLGGLGTMEHWVLRDWDAYGVSSGV